MLGPPVSHEEPEDFCASPVQTTLFELIETISEEVSPGENDLVIGIVLDLLRTGRVRFKDALGGDRLVTL